MIKKFFFSSENGNTYLDGYKIGVADIDEKPLHSKPTSYGLGIEYCIVADWYFLIQYWRVTERFIVGVQHRYYEEVNGVEQEYSLSSPSLIGNHQNQISLGFSYRFG